LSVLDATAHVGGGRGYLGGGGRGVEDGKAEREPGTWNW